MTWGYGSAGTYGFRRPRVRDRWHSDAGHGFFLDPGFCRQFWVPFFKDGTIVEGATDPEEPAILLKTISVIRLKYVMLSALALVALIFVPQTRNSLGEFFGSRQIQSKVAKISPAPALPTVKTILARVECEMLAMVSDDHPDDPASFHRLFLLNGDYDVAITLRLEVNDTGGLAPSLTYLDPLAGEKRPDAHNFTQDLQLSFRYIYTAWKSKRNSYACPDATLSGALGLKDLVANAALVPTLDVKQAPSTFGGSVFFMITENQSDLGPFWTLVHFNQQGTLTHSAVHKDEIKFAFAQGPYAGKVMSAGGEPNPPNKNASEYLRSR